MKSVDNINFFQKFKQRENEVSIDGGKNAPLNAPSNLSEDLFRNQMNKIKEVKASNMQKRSQELIQERPNQFK